VSELDRALRFELNKIQKINNKIFPTHAPEGKLSPFLVYIKSNFKQKKTLEGTTNTTEVSYLLNTFSSSYAELQDLTNEVKTQLLTFPFRTIGQGEIYIQDMTIHNIADTFENELGLYRSIIDIQFFYEEE
jgi:virulence-associated protein VapD